MSLLHQQSAESVHTGLDIFSIPPTQTAVEEGRYEEIYPLATITPSAPLEFSVSGATEFYLDFSNTYLHVQVKIVNGDGSPLPLDSTAAPVNNFLHSLFAQVDMSLNGVLVSNSENTYPYRAYLEHILSFGSESQQRGIGQTSLYYHDTARTLHQVEGDNNAGLVARRRRAGVSATMDLMSKLHLDMFAQNRYMLNGVDVKLRLVPSKNSFCLTQAGVNADCKYIITHASLFVRRVKLNPAVSLAHAKGLEKTTAKYPVKRSVVKAFSIPTGSFGVTKDNLFLNQTPTKLVIALCDSQAFTGSYDTNPYDFSNDLLNFIGLTVDGQQIPCKPLTPNFETKNYVRSYLTTLEGAGVTKNTKDGIGFSFDDFGHGYNVFCFDLSPSLIDGDQFELVRAVNVRIELKFSHPIPQPITVLAYGQLDGLIEIDKTRQVITDFSI